LKNKKKSVEKIEHSVKALNWGKTNLVGDLMIFEADDIC
jgi:hypothetical protein